MPRPGRAAITTGSPRSRREVAHEIAGDSGTSSPPTPSPPARRAAPRRAVRRRAERRAARPSTPPSSAARCGETGGLEQVGRDIVRALRRVAPTRAGSSWSGGPCLGSARPGHDRLEDGHPLALARPAWPRSSHATTVLPTPVSVPVTNSPRTGLTRRRRPRLVRARRRTGCARARDRCRAGGLAPASRAAARDLRVPPMRARRRVRGHRREPQPRAALRHGGRPDRLREDAARRARSQTSPRRARLADHQRHDLRSRPGGRRGPARRARRAASGALRRTRSIRRGCSRSSSSAASAAGDDRRRRPGREDQRARGVDEVLAPCSASQQA